MRRRSHLLSSPIVRQRLSSGILALAAALAGCGGLIRASTRPGSSSHSAGYLFDAAGWLIALFGAFYEAKGADLILQFAERRAKRRAIVLAVGGLVVALLGCYLASFILDPGGSPLAAAGANALLVGGIGSGLGGLVSLGWIYGGNYAAHRVERLSNDEW